MQAGPLIGILGGMGPLATAAFLQRLVELTPATIDQDHYRTLVYSNARIPDRSEAIAGEGPSPLPALCESLAMLERCGADFIAIPCNTAHYWLDDLAATAEVPVVGIVEAVADELRARGILNGRVGLLGTPGLLRAKVYERHFALCGYTIELPAPREIDALVAPAIHAIKAGDIAAAEPMLEEAIASLEKKGVVAVVMGCTEIPLAVRTATSPGGTPLIDSIVALAKASLVVAARLDRDDHSAFPPDDRASLPVHLTAGPRGEMFSTADVQVADEG